MSRIPHVIASIVSVQIGAAVATTVFAQVGAPGTVLLRQGLAAAVLLAVARPSLRGRLPADWMTIAALGVTFAVMSLCMYEAIARLPLGIAVTTELLGPLGLSAVLSRSVCHLRCVGLATIGVIVLSNGAGAAGNASLDLTGVAFALVAATGWAVYILLNHQIGERVSGLDGLALALTISSVIVAPLGIYTGGTALVQPTVLVVGFAVAMLSAAIPFALELHALRQIPTRTFGVMMSLSPAVAAMIGWRFLDESLRPIQVAAIGCVVVASVAATSTDRPAEQVRLMEVGSLT
jgi:inner membrane transporter RhtA